MSILFEFMVICGIVSSSGTKKEAGKNWIRRFWGATDTYTCVSGSSSEIQGAQGLTQDRQ